VGIAAVGNSELEVIDSKILFGLQGKEIVCNRNYLYNQFGVIQYTQSRAYMIAMQGNIDSVVLRRDAFVHKWRQ
jgi:hypothetical protein